MYTGLHVKYALLSDFKEASSFLDSFSENQQISNPMIIHPVGAELFHAGGSDGRTCMIS
jgi:hypothetical protein